MKEAYLYSKLEESKVRCDLCNFRCVMIPGESGYCMVRSNIDGILYSMVYEKAIAKSVDPIEKKPLFHFLPGTMSYSIATVGCNFRCLFCQNSDISQYPQHSGGAVVGFDYPCGDVVMDAVATGSKSIAYTYTEPTVFFEYAIDIAEIARERGIKNLFVTNGYMTKKAVDRMSGVIDAANVDLKAFSDAFYRDIVGGAHLKHVLGAIERMKENGMWMEITTLIIQGLNDNRKELEQLIKFIVGLDEAIPWHVSAFHPSYRMSSTPPTSRYKIEEVALMGRDMGLRYVYSGNVWGSDFENTYCYSCGGLLIRRRGFDIVENKLRGGVCPYCGTKIDIVLE